MTTSFDLARGRRRSRMGAFTRVMDLTTRNRLARGTKIARLALAMGFVVWNCGGDGGSSQKAATGRDSSSTESAQPGTSKEAGVATEGEIFKPAALQVAIGTTVTWTNGDSVVHTVTSGAQRTPDGKFHAELTERGKTFSFTFNEKGTFPYFCAVHPTMGGEVAVE